MSEMSVDTKPKGNGVTDFVIYDLDEPVSLPRPGIELALQSEIDPHPVTVRLHQLTRFADARRAVFPEMPYHLNWYGVVEPDDQGPMIDVALTTAAYSDEVMLTVRGVIGVLVPAAKRVHPDRRLSDRSELNHYSVYEIVDAPRMSDETTIDVADQFGRRRVTLGTPVALAMSVRSGQPSPPYDFTRLDWRVRRHITIHRVDPSRSLGTTIDTDDQFARHHSLVLGTSSLVGVSTEKHRSWIRAWVHLDPPG